MLASDRYDSLIRYYAAKQGLDWQRVKRQAVAESSLNPRAVSSAPAYGMMQFLPDTWRWVWEQMCEEAIIGAAYRPEILDPEDSIRAGCWYGRWLYDRFGEIPHEVDRYCFTLASYNAGRSNVNLCLEEARAACGEPRSFGEWDRCGRHPGSWQSWDFASRFLALVTGEDAKETLGYVRRIMGAELAEAAATA